VPDGFKWTGISFDTAVETMRLQYVNIIEELGELDKNLQRCMSDWWGPAREAYAIANAQWTSSAEKLGQLLNNAAEGLGNIHVQYAGVEDRITQLYG
jgi:WXG100 family type VII secretion target